MLRNYAILALLFVAVSACPALYAGDFVTRAGSSYAPAGDDSAARAGRAAVTAAMSECDTPVVTPDADAAPAATTRRTAHVGADDAVSTRAALPSVAPVADVDDKPAPASPHKARALRWQSLLPGVMK